MDNKTPLYDTHVNLNGKMVSFAGWLLPIQYSGIIAEHTAARQTAGIFDVSHMGELRLTGTDCLQFLNYLLPNDFTDMSEGRVRYSPMCYSDGGTVDDLLVYKFTDKEYVLVVNASNKDKDYEWIKSQIRGDVCIDDESDFTGQIALQGPKSKDIMQKIGCELPEKYYSFVSAEVGGQPVIISRTGYTGEFGYEIYCAAPSTPLIYDILYKAGQEFGLLACGLGCRDTLRLEAAMPLYGHELSPDISPVDCGLGFAIKTNKECDFIGKQALAKPAAKKRIGLELVGRGIARDGAQVYSGDEIIGTVTSGTFSPTLKKAIAMAYVPTDFDGEELYVDIRGGKVAAKVTPLPFYKR